jgi:hypothetical protein
VTVTADALNMLAGDPVRERKPGDFHRHPTTGAPYVHHPTDTTKTGTPRRVMYGRPSSFGTALDNPYNLLKWKERQLLRGISFLEPQWQLVDAEDIFRSGRRNAYCHDAAGTHLAADRGTHVHLLLEYHDNGTTWGTLLEAGELLGIATDLQCRIVEQWQSFRDILGVDAIGIEMTVVNDGWRLAGTLDRLDVPRRPMLTAYGIVEDAFVGDIKTGSLTLGNDGQPNYWVKYPVQLAAYVDAVPYDTDTDERLDWPAPPNPDIAIIYHYDLARALAGEVVDWQAIPVSVAAGRDGGNLCRAAADFGKRRDLFAMPAHKAAVPVTTDAVVVEQQTTEPATVPQGAGSVVEYAADRDRLRARVAGLIDAGHEWLLRGRWPDGVVSLKHRGHTSDELAEILAAVRMVEAEVGAPWHADDAGPPHEPRRRNHF